VIRVELPAYDLFRPERLETGLIFASPHSGRHYSDEFLAASRLDPAVLRSSEDAFVDRLFSAAPAHGAPLLCAHHPRAWVDLNRAVTELDPALIEDLPRGPHNPRVTSGLGVIPRVVAGGRAIYDGKIPLPAAKARLEGVWTPYHARLRSLIDEARTAFGHAILIDCHSMPHEALETAGAPGKRPQIVLGDRFGAAAAPGIVDSIESVFTALGLRCARNTPFAGAYMAQHYGRPARAQHVVQIEIDRALYMDERKVEPNDGFDDFKALMDRAVAHMVKIGAGRRDGGSLAAE